MRMNFLQMGLIDFHFVVFHVLFSVDHYASAKRNCGSFRFARRLWRQRSRICAELSSQLGEDS